jgi:hypothetical protein
MIVARLWTMVFGLLVTFSAGAAYAGGAGGGIINLPVCGVPIAVPEPSSLVLLASGIAGVAWLKFRRRK